MEERGNVCEEIEREREKEKELTVSQKGEKRGC